MDKQELEKLVKKILREYSSKQELYTDFAASIRRLIFLFLKSSNIDFHSITYRQKEVYSLKQKIKRKQLKGRTYLTLAEISDLAGVRIILYFKDDVDKVLRIINQEFFIHSDENVDRNNPKKESGYTSVHRIISLHKDRHALKEYSHFADLKCEIQIRTVLQHAWSEIEHKIGYKPAFEDNSSSRKEIQKIFKLTAKRLDIIDSNFVTIHNKHQEQLEKYIKKINKRKFNIPINIQSLETYLLKKENFQKIQTSKKDLLIIKYLEIAKDKQFKTIKDLDNFLTNENNI